MDGVPPTDVQQSAADGDLLSRFLVDRDVPCPRCRYNLRKLEGDRCPECGTELRLDVTPREPVQRLWIAATTIALLGAGIGLLFFVLAVGKVGMPPKQFWWVVFSSWCFFPLAAALISRRRRFLRWPVLVQRAIVAVLGVALAVIAVGVGTIQ